MDIRLSEQFGNRLGLDEFSGLVEVVVDDGFGFDSNRVVHGCEEFGGVHGIFGRAASGLIARAQDESPFGSRTGHDGGVAIGPVIAAIGTVAIAGCAHALLRRAAKLADDDHKRFVEQSA